MDLWEALVKVNVEFFSKRVFDRTFKQVSAVIYPSPQYRHFSISKKSGGFRSIEAPLRELRDLQRSLLKYLEEVADPAKSCVHGFVSGRSIVSNAQAHCNARTTFVLNIDLENFFPSINFYRVRGVFQAHPFKFSFEVATVAAHLCCIDQRLAQGAPTSPFVSNLICRSLDKQFQYLARRYRAVYTRYCDDLTFSFKVKDADHLPKQLCMFDGEQVVLGDEINNCIKDNGFSINVSKTRISSNIRRLEVTGLTINEFPNVKRKFIDGIRGALHSWEQYGYKAALDSWSKRAYKRELRSGKAPSLLMNLYGRLLYLKMVRGVDDDLYCRLAHRFNVQLEKLGDTLPSVPRPLPREYSVSSYNGAKNAVFVLEAEWGVEGELFIVSRQGTAFAIGEDYLLTCDHVITEEFTSEEMATLTPDEIAALKPVESADAGDAGRSIARHKVKGADGTEYPVSVVASTELQDIALLRFNGVRPAGLRFLKISQAELEEGMETVLLGFPNWNAGRQLNMVNGHITSTFNKRGVGRLETSQLIRQGNSGGPLIDKNFKVVGLATEGATYDHGNNECLVNKEIVRWVKDKLPDSKIFFR